MGKLQDQTVVLPEEEAPAADTVFLCCSKSTLKWLLALVLGFYVLAFALWSFGLRGSSAGDTSPSSDQSMPHIEASFRLRRTVSSINSSLPQLQIDLQEELGIPGTQIDVVSMKPLSLTNWTEVRFTVSPDQTNNSIAPAEMSILKETFVELFTQRTINLSLSDDVFGKVSHFEVINFPGGITVVPEQPGFPLSKVVVLFNFTLHNTLTHINSNFEEFRKQLAAGVNLKSNENLFVQLTNLEGSTLRSPLVVQTSILPVVGASLSTPRLKQLAEEVIASPRRNLGLNHTLFGRVKKIELSSYLQYSLEPAQAPSPGPSPAPSPSHAHNWASNSHNSRRAHRHHRCSHARAPVSEGTSTAAPRYHGPHAHGSSSSLAPSSASHASSYHHSCGFPPYHAQQSVSAPAPLGSSQSHIFKGPAPPPHHFVKSPKEAPSYAPMFQPPKEAPTYGSTFQPPKEASTSHMIPVAAPQGVAPASISSPSQSRERMDVSSPTSSAINLKAHLWLTLIFPVILAGIQL